uniref:Uncharacterized protein n=1 Tax=Anguilla anguilla TaxID=7936 RepID=A0A0E9SRE8_ANGAN
MALLVVLLQFPNLSVCVQEQKGDKMHSGQAL